VFVAAGAAFALSEGRMRYLLICLFIPSLIIPLAAVEWAFDATGSGLSVTDTRGAGQVTLFLVIFAMVAAFSRFVAGDRPLRFFELYRRHWRRALAGFLAMYAFAAVLVVVGYVLFALAGRVEWNYDALARLGPKIAERTVVALLVAVILAISEEILFRVFLMRYLRWNTTPLVTVGAVVFSSFVFAAAHNLTNPLEWFAPDQARLFLGLFLLGALLCVTYLSTGSFFCGVGVHAGLLGSKVFLRKTEILVVSPDVWWLGHSQDLRMAPAVWLLFMGMALAIFLCRKRLYDRFAIEKPVVSGGDAVQIESVETAGRQPA